MSIPFLAKPHQTQPRILKWAAEHRAVRRSVRQYVGFDVATATDTVPTEEDVAPSRSRTRTNCYD